MDKFREEWNYLINVKRNFLLKIGEIENFTQKQKQKDRVQTIRKKVLDY